MPDIIILPGIGNSGNTHWQSRWQARCPAMRRFRPSSWDRPALRDWIAALDREVAASALPPLLVAHSLACLLVAHWAAGAGAEARRRIAGAFLVAVPDPSSPAFPPEAAGFAPAPDDPLPFPALMVASSDDPFATSGYATGRAAGWGGGLVIAGALGHINGASNLGDWPQGRALLTAFAAGLRFPFDLERRAAGQNPASRSAAANWELRRKMR